MNWTYTVNNTYLASFRRDRPVLGSFAVQCCAEIQDDGVRAVRRAAALRPTAKIWLIIKDECIAKYISIIRDYV